MWDSNSHCAINIHYPTTLSLGKNIKSCLIQNFKVTSVLMPCKVSAKLLIAVLEKISDTVVDQMMDSRMDSVISEDPCRHLKENLLHVSYSLHCFIPIRRKKEEEEREKERKRQEKIERREKRRKEREEKRRQKALERKKQEEERKYQLKIQMEERRFLIAQRKLESIRLLSELFARVKVRHWEAYSHCPKVGWLRFL